MNIYIIGPIGYETAARLYAENREMLESRFAGFFLRQFEAIADSCINIRQRDPQPEQPDKPVLIHEIAEGGLFRALWEIGEELGCGMEVSLESIPIRQEVTEILELFKESPYECASRGSYVIAAKDSIAAEDIKVTEDILAAEDTYKASAIPGQRAWRIGQAESSINNYEEAAERKYRLIKIGETTESSARVVRFKDTVRYLTPPARQEKDILNRTDTSCRTGAS